MILYLELIGLLNNFLTIFTHSSKENGVYSDDGTSMCDVGKVLDIAGVGMHQVIGCNMFDLTNELAQGHRVIVGVDANELWYNDSITDKLKEATMP